MHRSVIAALLVFFIASIAHAQFNTGDTLTLSISPQNPRPYDTVTVTPSSNLIDLIASTVTVSVNGKVIETGTGVQSVPVTVGASGERTVISVTAKTAGKSYTTQVSLRPADVALIVDPLTTTHPFYRGAPLVAPSGRVKLVAIADLRTSATSRLDPSTLIYTWKLGDQVLQSSSGIGRSTLLAEAPVRYRDAQITVTVSSPDSSIIASASTVVSPVDPVTRIYHADALMGPDFDHALTGSYGMTSAEDAFRAVAYYFGTQPLFSWTVNGQSASNDRDVTVRSTGTGQGSATLLLTASGNRTQTASARLPISFGSKKTNIFGF